MIATVKVLINKHRQLISYGLITVFISLVDIIIVKVLLNLSMKIWLANTVGVIAGSILQYILTIKYTFGVKHSKEKLLIHGITFAIGLLLADIIIHYSYTFLLTLYSKNISFLLAKALSMVGTFFITFFLRKKLYKV